MSRLTRTLALVKLISLDLNQRLKALFQDSNLFQTGLENPVCRKTTKKSHSLPCKGTQTFQVKKKLKNNSKTDRSKQLVEGVTLKSERLQRVLVLRVFLIQTSTTYSMIRSKSLMSLDFIKTRPGIATADQNRALRMINKTR